MAINNVYRKLSIAYLTSPVASIFEYSPYVIAPECSMNRLIVIPIPQYATTVNDPVIIGIIKTSILRIKIYYECFIIFTCINLNPHEIIFGS